MKTKLIKNAAAALLALAMVLSMTACGHQHTWSDATCTTPKTCSECGKTEGEVLAHDWQEATCAAPRTCSLCKETEGEALPHTWEEVTCAAPKTCSVCGETEGEALPHTLTEANYQSPAVCTVCGAEVGEKLPAAFEEHPFPLGEQGVTYDCIFGAYNHEELDVTAHATLVDTQRFDSDEDHPAVEGYEYRTADIELEFYGDTFWDYGFNYGYMTETYYEPHNDDDEEDKPAWNLNENHQTTINYNGIDWEDSWIRLDPEYEWDNDAKTCTGVLHYSMLLPTGYDGMIFGIFDFRLSDAVDQAEYLAEVYEEGHFVLFRFA